MGTARVKSWKMHLFEGLLLLGCSGFVYWYFTDFENSHDASRRIHWAVAMLYNFGGKWLIIAIVLLLAVVDFMAAWKKWHHPV